jgi:hypothetical protein
VGTTSLVAALALGLRVWLARRGGGLWIDEAQLIWTSRLDGVGDMLRFVTTQDSHPPLYYLLTRGWLGLAGDTDVAALAPGIAFGVGIVVAVALIGRSVFSAATGAVAAVLVACSPLLAWHAAEARPYAFMGLLCVASTYALWRALRAGGGNRVAGSRLGAWAAYALLVVTMLWTHHWAWLVWGGHGVVALAWLAMGLGAARGRRARVGAAALAAQIVVVVAACVPLAPMLLYQSRHAGHGPASITSGLFTTIVSSLVFSFQDPAQDAVLLALLTAAALAAARGLWRALRAAPDTHGHAGIASAAAPAAPTGDRALGVALFAGAPLVAAAVAAVLSRRNNLFVPHTLVMIAPCLVLAVSHVIASLAQWVPARAPAVARAVPPAVATALLAGAHLHILVHDPLVKTNAREVAAAVAARARPDDLTLVLPQWYGSSFYRYYPLDRPRLDYPDVPFAGPFAYAHADDRLAAPAPFEAFKRRLAEARRQGRRVWVVTDRRWADLTEGDRLPPHVLPGSYRALAFRRAAETRRELAALYGHPGVDAVPRDPRPGWSMFHVLTYAP